MDTSVGDYHLLTHIFLNVAVTRKIPVNRFKASAPRQIDTNQLTCVANQVTGFYMMELNIRRLELKFKYNEHKSFNETKFLEELPFLYPLKMSKDQRFSDVFREYRNETLSKMR